MWKFMHFLFFMKWGDAKWFNILIEFSYFTLVSFATAGRQWWSNLGLFDVRALNLIRIWNAIFDRILGPYDIFFTAYLKSCETNWMKISRAVCFISVIHLWFKSHYISHNSDYLIHRRPILHATHRVLHAFFGCFYLKDNNGNNRK